MVSRALSLAFYILYLIVLAIALWFLLHYSGVPSWVWIFFGVAILIAIFGVLIKEFLLTRTLTTSGRDVTDSSNSFWLVFFVIMNIIVLILMIIGLIFVIRYSTIPWWVWVILAVAIFFSIISNVIMAFAPGAAIFSIITAVIALVLFIIGVILLIIYSRAPWWVWLIIGLAVLFAILASVFEGMAERNQIIVQETCVIGTPDCPMQTFQTVSVVNSPPVVN
jgi:hypothetical protein